MRPHRHIPEPDRITVQQARTQFAQWRACATDSAVAATTPDELARRFRLPPRELDFGLHCFGVRVPWRDAHLFGGVLREAQTA